MTRATLLAISILTVALASSAMPQDSEREIGMKDLPAAVQRAVHQQSQGAEIVGLSEEVEGGTTRYEAELRVRGHRKDVIFEVDGRVAAIEEETPLASIPAPARQAITEAAGSGRIVFVESVTEHGAVSYEAHVRHRDKTEEVKVDALGEVVK